MPHHMNFVQVNLFFLLGIILLFPLMLTSKNVIPFLEPIHVLFKFILVNILRHHLFPLHLVELHIVVCVCSRYEKIYQCTRYGKAPKLFLGMIITLKENKNLKKCNTYFITS